MAETIFLLALARKSKTNADRTGSLSGRWLSLVGFSVCLQGEISGLSYYEDARSVGLEPLASDLNYFQRPCLQSNQLGV